MAMFEIMRRCATVDIHKITDKPVGEPLIEGSPNNRMLILLNKIQLCPEIG